MAAYPPTPRPSPSTVDASTRSIPGPLFQEGGSSSPADKSVTGGLNRVLRPLITEPDEIYQAQAERRRAAEAEALAAADLAMERWLAERKPEEDRLIPLTRAVQVSAWLLSAATGILCISSAFNWEPRSWLYLLIPGFLLSLLPCNLAYEVKFTNGARGVPVLAALFVADAGSALFASRVLITFVPALTVAAAWGIATYHLMREQSESDESLARASGPPQ